MASRVGAVEFTIKKPREIRFLGRAAEHTKSVRPMASALVAFFEIFMSGVDRVVGASVFFVGRGYFGVRGEAPAKFFESRF